MEYAETVRAVAGRAKPAARRLTVIVLRTVLVVGRLGFFLVLNVALSAVKNTYSYALMQKKSQARQIQRENDNLRIDIAKLETPERIYTMATKKLGMAAPAQVLYSRQKETSGTAQTGR